MSTNRNTALTTRSAVVEDPIAGDAIVRAAELPGKLAQLQARANLVTPIVQISSLAEDHQVNLCVVQIDPAVDDNGNGPMCYRDKSFMSTNERGLGRIALDMIAQAAGISWLPYPYSRRTDDGRVPYLWAFTVVGAYTAMDGTIQTLPPGSAEVDLRDGSSQIGGWSADKWAALVKANAGKKKEDQVWTIGGWSEKRVLQARRFGLALAETKARTRAIRSLGIRQKYTVDELKKPFAIPRVSWTPDMSNPTVARVVTEHKMAGIAALYSRQSLPPAQPEPIDVRTEPEPTPVTSTTSTPASSAAAEIEDLPTTSAPNTTSTPGAEQTYTITKVLRQLREGQPTLYYVLTAETGEERLHTEDDLIAVAAATAKKQDLRVTLTLQEEEDPDTKATARWITQIEPVLPNVDARYVAEVRSKSGTGKNGRPYTRHVIIFNTGEEGSTFSDTIAKDAEKARVEKLPVKVQFEANEKYPDQQDITALSIIDTRQQGLPLKSEL